MKLTIAQLESLKPGMAWTAQNAVDNYIQQLPTFEDMDKETLIENMDIMRMEEQFLLQQIHEKHSMLADKNYDYVFLCQDLLRVNTYMLLHLEQLLYEIES